MNVLIACHAGSSIGLGHLTRSLVIGKALQKEFDANVKFLIQSEPISRPDLDEFEHAFFLQDQDIDGALLNHTSLDLLVLDLHPQRFSFGIKDVIKLLRASGVKVVGVDGLRNLNVDLDLMFVPSFQLGSNKCVRSRAPIVYGWDCFLVDDRIRPSNWIPGKNILVLTGGSDATHLGDIWPDYINQAMPSDVTVNWVTGPFAKAPKWPEKKRIRIVEHVAPESIEPLIRKADYAMTIFGVSFFELLYFGVPTVVFSPYGHKDDSELKEVSQAGLALVATDEKDATRQLCELMKNETLAMGLSFRAKQQLAVSGTYRFCEEIRKIIN